MCAAEKYATVKISPSRAGLKNRRNRGKRRLPRVWGASSGCTCAEDSVQGVPEAWVIDYRIMVENRRWNGGSLSQERRFHGQAATGLVLTGCIAAIFLPSALAFGPHLPLRWPGLRKSNPLRSQNSVFPAVEQNKRRLRSEEPKCVMRFGSFLNKLDLSKAHQYTGLCIIIIFINLTRTPSPDTAFLHKQVSVATIETETEPYNWVLDPNLSCRR